MREIFPLVIFVVQLTPKALIYLRRRHHDLVSLEQYFRVYTLS